MAEKLCKYMYMYDAYMYIGIYSQAYIVIYDMYHCLPQ